MEGTVVDAAWRGAADVAALRMQRLTMVQGARVTEPAPVGGGAAALLAAALLEAAPLIVAPELAIQPSPAQRLPPPVLSRGCGLWLCASTLEAPATQSL